jgi:anti-anti-sigma factor
VSLTIRIQHTTVVHLAGRLDSATAPDAEGTLAPVLATKPEHVVFDLAGLDYISSAGLRVLLGARKALSETGAECLVVNTKPQIQRVLDVIKSMPGLKIFTSAREADEYLAVLQQRVIDGDSV